MTQNDAAFPCRLSAMICQGKRAYGRPLTQTGDIEMDGAPIGPAPGETALKNL